MNPLFAALVDDAGLFPPTSLHLADALERHRRDTSPVLTHRFLCPASKLDRLRDSAYIPDRVGLIVDTPTVPDLSGLPVDLVEVRLEPGAGQAERLAAALPEGVRLFCEVLPEGVVRGLPEGAGLKVRCGGLSAEAFPTAERLAGFIRFCVDNGIPFKATAGLHHAVRHFDATLGVDRHGFLNLVAAVCEAVEGRDPLPVLKSTDVGGLVRLAQAVPEQSALRARQLLVSYGSCSTSAPVEDLIALGLIEKHIEGDNA